VVTKITFNPNDNHQVCTSGQNHWKLWRIQENIYKPMSNFPAMGNHNITDHCWMDKERLAGCTSEGEIIILEDFQQKQIIENAFMSEEIFSISCIQPYNKGFFIGSNEGTMALWVKSEENNQTASKEDQIYDFIRCWSPVATKDTKIISMNVNSSEDYVAAACLNNNIGLVNIKSIGLNESMSRDVKVDLVCQGFHSGPISCIDIAVQRPMIVTCSQEDSTIRIWNYFTNKCELRREYFGQNEMMVVESSKPLLTVAIHPSGYYLAAGCKDKIRIYHILHDNFRIFKNIDVKHCYKIKFSNGGHFMACVVQKSICIYKSYTCERVLCSPISSAHVTDLRFSKEDTCLCIVTMDGLMERYEYNTEWKKLNDGAISNKMLDLRACPFVNNDSKDQYKVVIAGGDGTKSNIKVFNNKNDVLQNYYGAESKVTSGDVVNIRNDIVNLITGTDSGFIKGIFNI